MADHILVHIDHKVKPTDAQKAAFDDLKDCAAGRHREKSKCECCGGSALEHIG